MSKFVFNDGGRAAAGYKGTARDCVVRAIAIASGKPYQEIYDAINELAQDERTCAHKKRSGARTGVWKKTYHNFILGLGFKWIPTMAIGSGCSVHLKADELPQGTLIVRLSKHLSVLIDGVINDIYDPSRNGTRCVYGYYQKI